MAWKHQEAVNDTIEAFLKADKMIQAIKLRREQTGEGLKEALEFCRRRRIELGCEPQREKERRMYTAAPKLRAKLAGLLEWAKGKRGSKHGNPYSVPEFKAALQLLAELDGVEEWQNVDTAKIAGEG